MKLLHIDSSALGDNSVSRTLTAAIVQRFRAAMPALDVVRYDLDADPIPHLTARTLAGADPEAAARAEQALQEFLAADVIVIGVPMYNFGIPSTLKAWVDRIAVAGKTFRYTENGPEGLVKGKRLILAVSQGGIHDAGSATEHQESHLRALFGLLGITDIEVVRAQGVNYSPQHREQALSAALSSLPDPRRLELAA
ncbi:MAG: FMN-dependent NADH-azoreductase [Dokdonella sp.]|nr:FMN-dependent NADH-azoreductase [Dokdonella sp.]